MLLTLLSILQPEKGGKVEGEEEGEIYIFNTQRDVWDKADVELLALVVEAVHAKFGTEVRSDYAWVLRR